MYYDHTDEFPHVVKVLEQKSVPNGSGGTTKQWTPVYEIDCFVDTPTTDRLVEASKLNITIHRDLYAPFETDIKTNQRFEFEGVTYQISGDMEDQGTMHEVIRVPLKKVT